MGVSDSGVMLQESRSLLAKRKDTRPENMTEEMRRNGFSWRRWLNPENVDNLPKSVKNLSGKPREAWEGLVELYKFSDNLARVANLVGERGELVKSPANTDAKSSGRAKSQSRRLRLNYTRTVPARSDTSDRVSYGRRKPALLFGF